MRAVSFLLLLPVLWSPAAVWAFEKPKVLPEGWDGVLQFGGQATLGPSRTSSVRASSSISYRSALWENTLDVEAQRNAARLSQAVTDENGDPVLDANGDPRTRENTAITFDRRFLGFEPRLYLTWHNYVFTITDVETNPPVDVESSVRAIGGIGYKFWNNKQDYLSAGIGVGNKRLRRVSGESEEGSIGYLGFKFVKKFDKRLKLNAEFESDFGGETQSTEFEFGLKWRFRDPLAVKLKYEARVRSAISNPLNPLDRSVATQATISLEVDVF